MRAVIVGALIASFGVVMPLQAQDVCETFSKTVYDASGDEVTRTPPEATFTAYLNRDSSRLVTDQTPLCTGSTFSGGGRIFVPVGRFPSVSAEDSVFVRVTDAVAGQQGSLGGEVGSENPLIQISLQQRAVPERPEVDLQLDGESETSTLTWTAKSGLTYQVYRRALGDVVRGKTRGVYQRVGAGITSGRFVDESGDPDSTYAYVVYARNEAGAFSPRSAERVETKGIPDLRVFSKSARNVTLRWGTVGAVPVGDVVGYNVYRRPEGGTYGSEPVGYTGLNDIRSGRQYTDTRLEPGRTYYYKVRARSSRLQDNRFKEFGESQEVAVVTESSTEGTYTYASIDVAAIIFRNSNDRHGGDYHMSDRAYRDIKFMLRKAKLYYWRNSKMKLNIDFTFYPVDEYVDFGEGKSYASANQAGKYLRDHYGVTRSQYELVLMLNAATGGNHSFGTIASDLRLAGPDRGSSGSVAYSHYPVEQGGDFFSNGVDFDNRIEGTSHIWLFAHEGQHSIDAIYNDNDQPQMGHGDFPELYGNPDVRSGNEPDGYRQFPTNYPEDYPEGFGKRFGKRFDFQATILRDFQEQGQAYEKLKPEWGDIYETPDQDGDGFPDRDSLVALDEARFGTSSSNPDVDGDGYTDKQEAISGIYPAPYAASDPHDVDSDGDGVQDGADKYPRYAGDTTIVEAKGFSPTLDGDVSEWPDSAIVSKGVVARTGGGSSFTPKVYMAYSSDSLYVALEPGAIVIPEFNFDFDADGRWYGAGNTEITFDISNERIQRVRSYDARKDVQACLERDNCPTSSDSTRASGDGLWDNSARYQQQFSRKVFSRSDLRYGLDLDYPNDVRIEFAIPKNEAAGLTLQPGEDIGFYVNYSKINNQAGAQATAFDPKSYAYMTLAGESVANSPEPTSVEETRLQHNYPNPFHARTTIDYSVAQAGAVRLTVYDVLGRRVKMLVDAEQTAGVHTVTWDGRGAGGQPVASGVYVYRLTAPGGRQITHEMTVVQ